MGVERLLASNEPVEKVTLLRTASSAGSQKRELFSVIEGFWVW